MKRLEVRLTTHPGEEVVVGTLAEVDRRLFFEFAYAMMAREAGIAIPEVRLLAVRKGKTVRNYFAIKRFDRAMGNRRFHTQTFANLVHVNFRIPSTDYEDLFKVTRVLTRDHRAVSSCWQPSGTPGFRPICGAIRNRGVAGWDRGGPAG